MADPWESDDQAPWSNDAAAAPPSDPKAYVPGQVAGYQVPGLATVANVANVAGDAGTFGLPDTIMGGLHRLLGGGVTADQARSDTQAARTQLGPVASAGADILGYAAGGGAAGVGESLAKLLGTSLGGRMTAGAVEGGGATLAGSLGHGETDPEKLGKDAIVGTVTGGLVGGLPSPRALPNTPTTADMAAIEKGKWAGPDSTPMNPSDVSQAIMNVHLGLKPKEVSGMAGPLENQINTISRTIAGSNRVSADDVAAWQKQIMSAARGDTQKRIAGQFSDALDGTLGSAGPMVDAANSATNARKTSGELDKLLVDPQGAPGAVRSLLANKGQFYSPEMQAMLGQVGGMDQQSLGKVIAEKAIRAGLGAATGYGIGAVTGGSPGSDAALAIGGALHGYGSAGAIKAMRARPINNALKAAQHFNNTGVNLPPSAFTAPSGMLTAPSDLLKKYIYSQGASGSGF